MISVYVDASVANSTSGGVGVLISIPGKAPLEFSYPLPMKMTPHHAEMCAIIQAAETVKTIAPLLNLALRGREVEICSDSSVCVAALANVADVRSAKLKKLAKAASRSWRTLRNDRIIYGFGWRLVTSKDNLAHAASRHARRLTIRTTECLKNQKRKASSGPS